METVFLILFYNNHLAAEETEASVTCPRSHGPAEEEGWGLNSGLLTAILC